MFWLPRRTETNSCGLGLCGCRLYRGMEKSLCDRPRGFWRLPTTTPRTTLIRRSAQDTGIDFRGAMFLINPMRTRLLWIHMDGSSDARNVTIAAVAFLCIAPPVTFESPCECRDNRGKHQWSVKIDSSLPPTNPSAIQTVAPSDIRSE